MDSFKIIKQRIWDKHLKSSLETKVFNVMCLFSAFYTFVMVVFNLINDIYFTLTLLGILFAGICILLFYLSFYKGINKYSKIILITSIGGILTGCWIYNQGIEGSTTILISTFVIITMYIFPRQNLLGVFAFTAVLVGGFLYLQFYAPNSILPYASDNERIKDVTITFVCNIILVGAVILLLKRHYENQFKQIELQKQAYEQMNEELKAHIDINLQQSEEITCTLEEIQLQKQFILSQNEQLEIKNNELKELVATKDKFFSIIGHDLKNPIAAIIGFADLLSANAGRYDQHKTEQFAKVISESSKHVFDLLENLLTWARCQTGKIEFKPQVVPIGTLADGVVVLLLDFAQRKGIEINLIKQSKAEIMCDSNMISTVLRNLISNSIKFTPSGGKINILIQSLQERVCITVSDTGVGMTENQISRLFKLGEQCNTSGTNNEPGTGLGLLLCKEFLNIHGCDLQVESTINVGSTFSFCLPQVL